MNQGVLASRIGDQPIAVVDFETTGFTPGVDRVVEVSVVHLAPGEAPQVVFDTLVNPMRRVAGTEIHGITDKDVESAPTFDQIAGRLVASLESCVVAAYNVYFDMKFLQYELSNIGVEYEPPHFCLMYLRTMLGLGKRCKLEEACTAHGVDHVPSHIASDDAMAAARLFSVYLEELSRVGVATYSELAGLRSYKFNNSFCCDPFPSPAQLQLTLFDKIVSRAGFTPPVDPVRRAFSDYWDALKVVLADLEVSDDEIAFLLDERRKGGLRKGQIRVLHARGFFERSISIHERQLARR